MMRYSFFIGAIILFSLINGERITAPTEVSIPRQITAGDPLVFTFTEADRSSKLYVENGYGQTIILPSSENVHLFQVPSFISEKSGTLEWKFLNAKKNRAGVVQISAQEVPRLIENYFGPRSIQAGDNDYSMLVSIPTDRLDNPLSDGTKVNFSEYFQGNLINDSIPMRNMFAWKNVYTKRKAANITVSASAEDLQSKEMISQVYPSVATDFMISTRREHEFA
ncbi:MAG: hypothetical protein WA951_14800, partial [Leeuwenhoekiella sp.]